MDIKGDLTNDWEFFKESWTNFEIAPDEMKNEMKNGKIRVATLTIIRIEALLIYHHLLMT